ncbi:MAG TPA: hypothetical protein P5328_01335 [Candidatus Paceibacterota bacterium]|nr:hypothetical protein [Candidatus Paceibacterota bacterium]HRZ34719.1 hypothetical protein [Candidatus Paceibacterota bacterium]
MTSWGTERRNRFISFVILILLIVAGYYLFLYFSQDPTCFDGKRNGDETGVDCGGSCQLFCDDEIVSPVIHWVRHFEIVPGIYNVIAYIENLNTSAGVGRADYIFKLYDEKNVVLTERKGYVSIRPKEIIPVVEGALNTGKLTAVRSAFAFIGDLTWTKETPRDPALVVSGERYFEVDGLPRISGVLTNTSLYPLDDISAVAIIYDSNGNASAASRTFFESIGKDQSVDFIFTWPQKFSKPLFRFEIIPLYDTSR